MRNKHLKIAMVLHLICIGIFLALLFTDLGFKSVYWKLYYLGFLLFNIGFLLNAIRLDIKLKRDIPFSSCKQCFHLLGNKCTRIGTYNGKMGVCWFEEEY